MVHRHGTCERFADPAGAIRRERNLDELSGYLSEHERQTLVIVMDDAPNATHGTLAALRLLLGLNPAHSTGSRVILPVDRPAREPAL